MRGTFQHFLSAVSVIFLFPPILSTPSLLTLSLSSWTTLLRTVRLRASCASTASLPTILRPSAPLLRRVSATCVGLPSTSGMRVRSVPSLRHVRLRRTEEAEEEGAGVRGSSGATSAERTTIWSASATSTTPSWLLPKSPATTAASLAT